MKQSLLYYVMTPSQAWLRWRRLQPWSHPFLCHCTSFVWWHSVGVRQQPPHPWFLCHCWCYVSEHLKDFRIAENFCCMDKYFAKPSYLCIAEILFSGLNILQCSKGRRILYVIINTEQKFENFTN